MEIILMEKLNNSNNEQIITSLKLANEEVSG